MRLAQLLFSQGFGSRRECEGLVMAGRVAVRGAPVDDPFHEVDPVGLVFTVDGQDWPYAAPALLMLNKPTGTECSLKPKYHPSVYGLLPAPLRRRNVQSIGRLDADTTGLLLFTDDGQLLHRWTSPKHHVPKVYEVGCKHPIGAAEAARLVAGVELHDEPGAPVRAAAAEATGPRPDGLYGLTLTLTEGKYHQVKRMVAAVGNRVEALHRRSFGALVLPADLAPGDWRWLPGPEAVVLPTG